MLLIRPLLAILILALSLYLEEKRPNFLEQVNLKFEDSKFYVRDFLKLSPKPFKDLVVVAIDEKSINELGRWPWSRKTLGEIIERMCGAKVIALDIVFSEPTDEDQYLAKAIRKCSNVVLGFFLRNKATQDIPPSYFDILTDSEFLNYEVVSKEVGILELPYAEVSVEPILSSAYFNAPFNTQPDLDGIFRNYTIAYAYKGSLFLTLAFQTLRLYKKKDFFAILDRGGFKKLIFEDKEIPVYRGNFIKLNFYPRVRKVSSVDVLRGKVDLKGKIVLVGVTEIGIYDVRPTPVNPITPGVFLHYTALSNLIKGDFLYEHQNLNRLFTLLLPLLAFLLSLLRSFHLRLSLHTLVLTSFVSLCYFLFFKNQILNLFYPLLGFSLSFLTFEGLNLLITERRVNELRRAFSSYVSPKLLEIIVKNPEKLKLGGEKREVSVLFSDVRNFTTISENLEPERLVSLLNRLLDPLTQVILSEGGMLDKYIGDAIMALFNAPVDLEEHPTRAVRSALRMVEELERLNRGFKREFGLTLNIGIGINTGLAVVGNMGSRLRFDYTAIGDTVNLASRLEGLNRIYGTRIIISQYTREKLKGGFLVRLLDLVAVKGKRRPVFIYEVMSKKDARGREIKNLFEEAFHLYLRGEFERGYKIFKRLYEEFRDPPSGVFLKRCEELMKVRPKNWKGIYVLTTK